MVHVDLAVFNHRPTPGDGVRQDFTGLVATMQERWPDILVLLECRYYLERGGAGMHAAATALSEASGRPYQPCPGILPEGPNPPIVFADRQKVNIHRWYGINQPDLFHDKHNLLVASVRGSSERFQVKAEHCNPFDGDIRLSQLKRLHNYGKPNAMPTVIAGDFNCVPSGPEFARYRLDNIQPWQRYEKGLWQHGQREPYRADTRAMDYAIGWWDDELKGRVEGAGFFHVGEHFGDYTPTVNPGIDAYGELCIDGFLVNAAAKATLIPGSYAVHEAVNPVALDSDHKRVSVTCDF